MKFFICHSGHNSALILFLDISALLRPPWRQPCFILVQAWAESRPLSFVIISFFLSNLLHCLKQAILSAWPPPFFFFYLERALFSNWTRFYLSTWFSIKNKGQALPLIPVKLWYIKGMRCPKNTNDLITTGYVLCSDQCMRCKFCPRKTYRCCV